MNTLLANRPVKEEPLPENDCVMWRRQETGKYSKVHDRRWYKDREGKLQWQTACGWSVLIFDIVYYVKGSILTVSIDDAPPENLCKLCYPPIPPMPPRGLFDETEDAALFAGSK